MRRRLTPAGGLRTSTKVSCSCGRVPQVVRARAAHLYQQYA